MESVAVKNVKRGGSFKAGQVSQNLVNPRNSGSFGSFLKYKCCCCFMKNKSNTNGTYQTLTD